MLVFLLILVNTKGYGLIETHFYNIDRSSDVDRVPSTTDDVMTCQQNVDVL